MVLQVPQEVKHGIIIRPNNPTPRYMPPKLKVQTPNRYFYTNVYSRYSQWQKDETIQMAISR